MILRLVQIVMTIAAIRVRIVGNTVIEIHALRSDLTDSLSRSCRAVVPIESHGREALLGITEPHSMVGTATVDLELYGLVTRILLAGDSLVNVLLIKFNNNGIGAMHFGNVKHYLGSRCTDRVQNIKNAVLDRISCLGCRALIYREALKSGFLRQRCNRLGCRIVRNVIEILLKNRAGVIYQCLSSAYDRNVIKGSNTTLLHSQVCALTGVLREIQRIIGIECSSRVYTYARRIRINLIVCNVDNVFPNGSGSSFGISTAVKNTLGTSLLISCTGLHPMSTRMSFLIDTLTYGKSNIVVSLVGCLGNKRRGNGSIIGTGVNCGKPSIVSGGSSHSQLILVRVI